MDRSAGKAAWRCAGHLLTWAWVYGSCDASSRMYAVSLKARGKKGGVIACAMAHRAARIAYAMVRDQAPYDPTRWQ